MSKSMEIKDMLKQTIFTVTGDYDWEGLREEFLPIANDIPKAEEVLDTIRTSLLFEGIAIDDYRFFVSVVIASEANTEVLGHVAVVASLSESATALDNPRTTPQFVFPLLEASLDGSVEVDVANYGTLQSLSQDGSYAIAAPREPLFATSVKQLETQKREQRQAVRPIFGWVKEVMRKNIFSYDELKEVLKPAFYEEDVCQEFWANLNFQLAGEFPVLDVNHPLFNLKFNNSEASQYATLSIVYHSQRANAHPKHNTLHVLSELSWGDNADFPLILTLTTTYQPISYTGDLLENAGMVKRFEFHRAESKVGPHVALADQLDAYLHDKALAALIESRLVKSGIHHLVRRVSMQLSELNSENRESVSAVTVVSFHPVGQVGSPLLAQLTIPMQFVGGYLSYSHELGAMEVNAEAVWAAQNDGGEKIVAPQASPLKFDIGAGLQAMADQPLEQTARESTQAEKEWAAKMATKWSKKEAPVVVNSRSFDLNFEMEFTDPIVGMPVLYAFEQKLPGIGDKYRELCAMLSDRARLTGSETVVFTVVGHVGDEHEPNTTMVELTLTHEQTLDGNSIRTQVNAVMVA
jgi:hypothetical protein